MHILNNIMMINFYIETVIIAMINTIKFWLGLIESFHRVAFPAYSKLL